MVCKKKNPSYMFGTNRKICPSRSLFSIKRQPNNDPRGRFFYPLLTPIKGSYNMSFCIALGTRVEDAKAILAASALRMFASDDLDNAAAMVRFPFVFITS